VRTIGLGETLGPISRVAPMEMHQIRYFFALCEELNFTEAAKRCQVSQPALTRAIRKLEEEFGGPLFHRERANTHISELGRTVLPYLRQVYQGAESAKRQADDFVRLQKTPLRLGLMCTIAPALLLDLVNAVQVRHPGVALQILDAAAPSLRDRLLGGDLEVAIYALPEVPQDDRLHYLSLFREHFMIVMHLQHRLVAQSEVKVRDLDGERYLSRVHCEYGGPADRIFDEQRVDCATVYESERDDWILAMAAAGLGIGFMPQHSVNHPAVIARPLVAPEFWRDVAMVTVRGRPHSPAVGALVAEAMRRQWVERPALAVQAMLTRAAEDEQS
jgi:LysR family transcriptional regulator, hydrogen peroxide-inducible genes activator